MTPLRQRLEQAWAHQLARSEERERRRARRLPTWRTRKHRSVLATVMLLGCLLMITASTSVAAVAGDPRFTLWFPGFGAYLVAAGLLRTLTGKFCGFMPLLDEREREWRHRVTSIGFIVMVVLMLLGMFYYRVFLAGDENAGEATTLMIGALTVLGASTPLMLLGWTLPDDYPEDVEERDQAVEHETSIGTQQHNG